MVCGENQTLFCPGIPGAGKSILASVAIEYLRSAQNVDGTRVAFLYCNYRMQEEQTVKSLLATLLRQLVDQCVIVPEPVKTLYASYDTKTGGPSIEEISKTFFDVVGHEDRVFLIVDALDECSDDTRRTLLTEIWGLQKNTKISFMATSRPIDDLELQFAEYARLEIRADTRDVEIYLDAQLEKLPKCVRDSRALQRNIKNCISKAVDGM